MSSSSDDKRPSRVLEHLFIGSRAHAKNRGLLTELGINRILNVTPPRTMDPTNGVPNFFEKDRSMTYKRVAVFDNRGEDLLQHLASCISFIEQGSFYGRVLVHCNKGVSRSSTVVAGYLMSTRGLSKDAALAYLRKRRPIVNPHEGFLAQLEAFETKLKEEREAAIADGQAKKFPDDLLEAKPRRSAAQGPSIGPIGPPRGPTAAPRPGPQNARSTSPTRGPANRPTVGVGCAVRPSTAKGAPTVRGPSRSSSPPRHCGAAAIGPSRGPSSLPPSVEREQPVSSCQEQGGLASGGKSTAAGIGDSGALDARRDGERAAAVVESGRGLTVGAMAVTVAARDEPSSGAPEGVSDTPIGPPIDPPIGPPIGPPTGPPIGPPIGAPKGPPTGPARMVGVEVDPCGDGGSGGGAEEGAQRSGGVRGKGARGHIGCNGSTSGSTDGGGAGGGDGGDSGDGGAGEVAVVMATAASEGSCRGEGDGGKKRRRGDRGGLSEGGAQKARVGGGGLEGGDA